jgi:tRNA A37 threonylcarbamoyladenosine synthetase subunit TsaC/SUA5/YrdC
VQAAFPEGCLIVDGGQTPGGAASTLARVRGEGIEVLRPGPIAL